MTPTNGHTYLLLLCLLVWHLPMAIHIYCYCCLLVWHLPMAIHIYCYCVPTNGHTYLLLLCLLVCPLPMAIHIYCYCVYWFDTYQWPYIYTVTVFTGLTPTNGHTYLLLLCLLDWYLPMAIHMSYLSSCCISCNNGMVAPRSVSLPDCDSSFTSDDDSDLSDLASSSLSSFS